MFLTIEITIFKFKYQVSNFNKIFKKLKYQFSYLNKKVQSSNINFAIHYMKNIHMYAYYIYI